MIGLRAIVLRAALVVPLLAGGCELAVPSELGTVRCANGGAVGPPACRAGEYCNAGVCAPCVATDACGDGLDNDCDGTVDDGCTDASSPVHPGGPCTDACTGELSCLDLSLLGVAGASPICSRPCCTSADCGDASLGAVCWPTPNGGAVCRQATEVARPAPGAGKVGAPCGGGSDCRSSVCDERGTCVDACCSDTACASSDEPACVLREDPAIAPDRAAWSCGAASGQREYLGTCQSDADCKSGFCASFGAVSVCSKPCCKSIECGEIAVPLAGSYEIACAYGRHGSGWVRACIDPFQATSPLDTGKACTADAQCRSDRCFVGDGSDGGLGGAGSCTDTCCSDVDCGDPTTLACRPLPSGGEYGLRCQPR